MDIARNKVVGEVLACVRRDLIDEFSKFIQA